MNITSKAKSLITGELNEGQEEMPGGAPGPSRGPGGPPRRPGGPPRRERGPGGFGGPPREDGLSPDDQSALKDLIILDLLQALGGDAFYAEIAAVALKGSPLTPAMIRHFMDEAPRYAESMSPEVNELMGKLSKMPTQQQQPPR
jgi:hypothetical protein